MKKIYDIIKTVLFAVSGILVIVFNGTFMKDGYEYLPVLVGVVMAYYGLEAVLKTVVYKRLKQDKIAFLNGGITLLLGIIVLLQIGRMDENLKMICVLWSVWAIMREGEEIAEKVVDTWDVLPIAIINAVESFSVIAYSVMLMLNPVYYHIRAHIILLGAELILEVSWEYLYLLIKSKKSKAE